MNIKKSLENAAYIGALIGGINATAGCERECTFTDGDSDIVDTYEKVVDICEKARKDTMTCLRVEEDDNSAYESGHSISCSDEKSLREIFSKNGETYTICQLNADLDCGY